MSVSHAPACVAPRSHHIVWPEEKRVNSALSTRRAGWQAATTRDAHIKFTRRCRRTAMPRAKRRSSSLSTRRTGQWWTSSARGTPTHVAPHSRHKVWLEAKRLLSAALSTHQGRYGERQEQDMHPSSARGCRIAELPGEKHRNSAAQHSLRKARWWTLFKVYVRTKSAPKNRHLTWPEVKRRNFGLSTCRTGC